MRTRHLFTMVFVVLSLQLALVPLFGVIITDSRLAPELSSSAAAKDKKAKPQKQRLSKNKKQKNKKQKQRAKQEKRSNAKKRNQRAARQGLRDTNLGQASVPQLPGGPLKSAQREVSRLKAQSQDPGERYIVLYANERVNSRTITTALDTATPGVIPIDIYEHAIKGFSAYLTPEAKQALEQDPRVATVMPDRKRQIAAQRVPRGISRIGDLTNPTARIDGRDQRVSVDIAIIDTGIDFDHPDLNVFAYADCTDNPEFEGWDLDGHGTHVAGTAAALDNNIGVVGVAPGARIWAMRVQDDFGDMLDSYIIGCMDLAAEFATTPFNGQTIDVANMSLGGLYPEDRCGIGDPFNDAVCGMVSAGITTVVAAGNESSDAASFNPANIDQVITVSALADTNGKPGAPSGTYSDPCTNSEQDESLASFSNFGADVDIAAPGVGILSTFPEYLSQSCVAASGVGYDVFPGTSMASPHVAGAAGLLLAQNPNMTPAQVRTALISSREQVGMAGDPDGINEGVLRVGDQDTTGPAVTVKGPGQAKVGQPVSLNVTANDPWSVARVVLYQCKPACKVVAQDTSAPYKFVRKHQSAGTVKYKIRAYDGGGNFSEKAKTVKVKPKKAKKRR